MGSRYWRRGAPGPKLGGMTKPAQEAAPAAPEPAPAATPEPAPKPKMPAMPKEIGGPTGPEPTRYGDWERKGRVSDF